MNKVAVFIVNYNMPERADGLYEYLQSHTKTPTDIYMIDNGSDIMKPSQYSNVLIEKNVQTTNGWLRGLEEADKKGGYFAYMFLITSAKFVEASKEPIDLMIQKLEEDNNAVGVHASLTESSTTSWYHLKCRNTEGFRRTWFIENICNLYRAEWFDKMGRFDKRLVYAHGIDLETSYNARRNDRSLWVDDRVQVEKISNIGYTMDRMNMTANDRNLKAHANMEEVLREKYGDDWYNLMMLEGVEESWK